MPKKQNKKIRCAHAQIFYGAQSIRNAAETYNIFFADFLVGSLEMSCNKISENPRKVAGSRDEENQKTNIFSNSTSL